ncbi:hypothetical protein BJ085DRAFT_37935 [Dimargaris cristalligena]|uniref:BRCT domain-containing protein n=1 Tax=Dimargaris cristalligena TaxID=215637 RepID=A0A4P9ZU55_9FUNG|nr:hypothetical protein BJ085DRAFT_37935 [Dimargaris cristalligena]|eukprot:RKP37057.1 hypothetical protein BJ085DRAFT_37935 [Dimargaris cristalligena]
MGRSKKQPRQEPLQGRSPESPEDSKKATSSQGSRNTSGSNTKPNPGASISVIEIDPPITRSTDSPDSIPTPMPAKSKHPMSPSALTSNKKRRMNSPPEDDPVQAILARFGELVTTVPEKKSYNHWAKKPSAGPSAPGSKEVPRGDPSCLTGLTFVITGELPCIARSDTEDLIKRHGGRVTSAPSSKTTFVIVGDDPGSSKLEKAQKLKIKTLDEDSLFDLIRALSAQKQSTPASNSEPSVPSVSSPVTTGPRVTSPSPQSSTPAASQK